MSNDHLIQWLLAAETPSIRYLTMRDIIGFSLDAPEMVETLKAMRSIGPIPAILGGQMESGAWSGEKSYYTPKYTSTHWSMLLLSELYADPSDEMLLRGREYMLTKTAQEAKGHADGGQHGLECFWGNLLRYVLYIDGDAGKDPRISNISRILAVNAPQADWCCVYNDDRPCAWGAARALWGLAKLPEEMRTNQVKTAIESGLCFLIDDYNLVNADYPIPERGKIHSLWSRTSFPLFYQADILFVLRVLMEYNELDRRGTQPALDWLASRRLANGSWRGSSPYRSKTWREFGDRGETDRWVSLYATLTLRSVYEGFIETSSDG